MERFQEEAEKANKAVRIADHMLTQSYPLINDPKLLLAVIDNLYNAVQSGIRAVLYHERLFKQIPPFSENFEAMYVVFKNRHRGKEVTEEYFTLVDTLQEIVYFHKKSPLEFVRKDKFVICSDNYRMRTIGLDEIKRIMQRSKQFISICGKMVEKHERIPHRSI